ncbi:MAG: hypothetical protein LBC68_12865 [Prevotellaceae bacterium]|jgi:hypothetical protein|nr:hypothetical protein [Prevotellaceae bacterium]
MKSKYFLIISVFVLLVCVSCNSNFLEVDVQQLQEKIYEPEAIRFKALNSGTTLYLDHSTCVIDARRNSPVFKSLLGQLGLYTDTLCLIKGQTFEVVPNTDKSPTSTDVYNIINGIGQDIPFADIGHAVNNICEGNSQAILITDCEYFDKNGKNQDGFPYLSGAFKNWLEKGHVIYIVTEPYKEKVKGRTYDKKRFYFIFTNDRMQAPISHNLLNELKTSLQNNLCSLFKLTNSDLFVKREGDLVEKDLTVTYEDKNVFDYIEIDNDWDDIREYVMKLDKYGEPLEDEKPLPLVQNLIFNEGENYIISDVEVVASDITARYLALSDSLWEESIPAATNISDGFLIDKEALKSNKLNVLLTDKIFNYLTDEFGGNLIRLDFVITKVGLKQYDANIFTWQSIYNSDLAICVAKSIDNALRDIEVVPTTNTRKVIHTVFLKTQSYN